MSDQTPPPPSSDVPPPPPPQAPAAPPPPPAPPAYAPPPPGYAPVPMGPGPIGKVRGTGVSILLFIVTFSIYGFVWWWKTHDEMKNHTGQGLGGPVAFIIAFLIAPVAAFLTSDEVGKLYERRGQQKPVSAVTGLWYFPGMLLIVLPIVWFVKTNGALNDYWRSLGAQG